MTTPEPMTEQRLSEIETAYEPLRGDHGDHVRELIAALRIVTRQADGYARAYSVLWKVLEEISQGVAEDRERAEPGTLYAATLDGIAGVVAKVPDWARPHA